MPYPFQNRWQEVLGSQMRATLDHGCFGADTGVTSAGFTEAGVAAGRLTGGARNGR